MLLSLETQDLSKILNLLQEVGEISLLEKIESETEVFLQKIKNTKQEIINMAQEQQAEKPTSFGDFTFSQVLDNFALSSKKIDLFDKVEGLEMSQWLKETLEMSEKRPLRTEKERSEVLISPILTEVQKRNNFNFQVFSGEQISIDKDRGLKGEFDFALTHNIDNAELSAPIFTLVEAKQADITKHWGQLTAQMVGAKEENQKEGKNLPAIFGCVTSGENWRFAKLENDNIYLDTKTYYLVQVEKILGIFQFIVDFYKD